ncbi:telomere length regulation protein-domain-containing protein [Xylariales sp. PMI_506]|nr:telomere length regulation protein-domain-containing protein [Xylariales sp. PMI_506]
MDDLLKPVSRTYRNPQESTEFLTLSKPATIGAPVKVQESEYAVTTPEDALEALKGQPSYSTLLAVLKYLQLGLNGNHPFNILKPSPQSAQIVNVLVTEIVPNYWTVLSEDVSKHGNNHDRSILLDCLSSITGINACLAFLRTQLHQAKNDPKALKTSDEAFNLVSLLDLLSNLLEADTKVETIWKAVTRSEENSAKLRVIRQEFVSIFASGKIVSLAAEAEHVLKDVGKLKAPTWVGDSKVYVHWLGQNLIHWIKSRPDEEDTKLCSDILTRSLKLGHTDTLIQIILRDLLNEDTSSNASGPIIDLLPQTDQRKILVGVLQNLSGRLPLDTDTSVEEYPLIWAAAGMLKLIVGTSQIRQGHLIAWLTDAVGAGIGEGSAIRRAAMAVLGGSKEAMTTVLEKSLAQFGDQLYIRHAPVLQQEAHAQVLLLSAGYVYRLSPIKLTILLRSSSYLNAISNRISASQDSARFLGMVVGEALSGLVHGDEKKLDFHIDDMNSEKAQWYKSLVNISDQLGPISPLRNENDYKPAIKQPRRAAPSQKATPPPPRPKPQSGFIIEEIEDDDEADEDDDLVPYAKPDSDDEDSDDDPTMINRDKPKAPIYIRDLITYLRDTENYDRQKLALTSAPVLIRRKANYGTEVSAHADELATLLVGLEDKYDLPDFWNLRLQGMTAIIVAQPAKMGLWFAKTFFDGDYSLSQRASILIVLGLGGREIAGFDASEYAEAAAFPSKQLPEKLQKHYALPSSSTLGYTAEGSGLKALPSNALDNISQTLSQTFLAPLAAEAADAATGPDALKLSSFTSRLRDPSKSRAVKKKTGVRGIPNKTASLLASSFFFPLSSRFLAAMHSASGRGRGGEGGGGSVLFEPSLLALYVKTLALLLHAAGPSTLALPQMTSELWDLLLGTRGRCLAAADGVTGAVLFALMTLLDVNEGDMRGLCERHGREVVETVEWVSGVFDHTRGGDDGGSGEENQVKMMAAGVLIRLREAMEKYRALLLGDMIGFT